MKRPWMPLYVADYIADTTHLSVAESGAYFHLIMHYWVRGGLPDDERLIRRITKMTARQWLHSRDILMSLFGDHWSHPRIDRELSQVIEKSKKLSANAKLRHSKSTAEADTLTLTLKKKKKESCSNEFERFWKAYPRRVGKKVAEKALTKALRETSIEAIEQALARQTPLWTDPKFIPHPATWLNQGRWADDLPEAAPKIVVSEEEFERLRARHEQKLRQSL